MLTYANISAFSIIAEIDKAISLSRQKNENVTVNVAGVQVFVKPESNLSETVALWEELWEEQQEKNKK